MASPELFARVLVGKHSNIFPALTQLIQDLDNILVAINSGKMVNVEAFRQKCDSILDFFHGNSLLNWNVLRWDS